MSRASSFLPSQADPMRALCPQGSAVTNKPSGIARRSNTLLLDNRFLHVEIALAPFFRIEEFQNGAGRVVSGSGSHLLLADRVIHDLHASGICEFDEVTIAGPETLYQASGTRAILTYRIRVPGGEVTLRRHLYLYRNAAAIRWYDLYTSTVPLAGMYYSDLGGFQVETSSSPVCVDYFSCTDQSNWRLQEKPASRKNQGNFLLFPDAGDRGLFFYKEGPFPDSQPIKGEYDFVWSPADRSLSMVGLGFDNLRPGEVRRANGCVLGLLEESHSLLGLHRYQLARYHCDPASEVETLANSWPTFEMDINEAKILEELDAASASGIDTLFIDAGWFDKFMGEVDLKRFPSSFTKISERAGNLGIHLGIWMNPLGMDSSLPEAKEWDGAECRDSMNEANPWNWLARTNDFVPVELRSLGQGATYSGMDLCHPEYFRHIREKILALHRDFGVGRFKFDLYQLSLYDTLLGDANIHYEAYRQLLHELKSEIPGLVISMDVTRRNRPNFDFGLDFGRLFLENRGRNLSDHRCYQPYISLRNLWSTLKYAPACKLEIEMMPQIDDACYPLDYILGTGVFANPLYWGALIELSLEKRSAARAFFTRLAPHRREIMRGLVFPAGEMPDLGNFSAIVSVSSEFPEKCSGYIGVYRNGSACDTMQFRIPLLHGRTLNLESVCGRSMAFFDNGALCWESSSPFDFQLLYFTEG
jgi:hypothetical protein